MTKTDFKFLEFKHFIAPSARTAIKRAVNDYELDFYIKDGRTIVIDGSEKDIRNGDAI